MSAQSASSASSVPSRAGPPNPSDAAGSRKPPAALAPGLYPVAVPIGNLRDITLRALDILGAADLILAEDTRAARRLLSAHGLAAKPVRYDEHNAEKMRPRALAALEAGQAVALISEAGTPLISDPGYKLVGAALAAGHRVHAVPGPSAALAAMVGSGIASDRFLFAGFPPAKSAARRTWAAALAPVPASLILYESPRRLAASLADLAAALGPREAAVMRELTKLYEERRAGTLDALAAHYADTGPPKGEIVLVIAPPREAAAPSAADTDALLRAVLAGHRVKEAAGLVAEATGLPRRRLYARALELTRSDDAP